jgi:hypothetical protein
MNGSYTIHVVHNGKIYTRNFFTGKAFRASCQQLLRQSEIFRRTFQSSHVANFVEVGHRDRREHGASAPRTAPGAMPPPRVIRGEIDSNKVPQ